MRVRPPMLVAATVTVGTVAALALVDPLAAGAVGARAGRGRSRSSCSCTGTSTPAPPGPRARCGWPPCGRRPRCSRACPTCGRTGSPAARRRRPRRAGRPPGAVRAHRHPRRGAEHRPGRRSAPGWPPSWPPPSAPRRGWPGRPLAVLALAPLALAEPLTGLVAALQRRGALADAQGRLDAVLTAPVPADPARPTAGAGAGAPRWRSTTSPPAGRAAPTCCAA